MSVVLPPSAEYLELIKAFPLRRIHTEDQFDAAVALSGQLIRRSDLTDDEEEYLEVLCDLIAAYEDVHYPLSEITGAQMLERTIESRDVTREEVARGTGIHVTTLDEIIRENRPIAAGEITKLADYFKIDPSLFAATVGPDAARR